MLHPHCSIFKIKHHHLLRSFFCRCLFRSCDKIKPTEKLIVSVSNENLHQMHKDHNVKFVGLCLTFSLTFSAQTVFHILANRIKYFFKFYFKCSQHFQPVLKLRKDICLYIFSFFYPCHSQFCL